MKSNNFSSLSFTLFGSALATQAGVLADSVPAELAQEGFRASWSGIFWGLFGGGLFGTGCGVMIIAVFSLLDRFIDNIGQSFIRDEDDYDETIRQLSLVMPS